MGELRGAAQTDRGRRSFDAMGGDQKPFDFGAVVAAFHGQQRLGELVEGQVGLVDEDGQVLCRKLGFVFDAVSDVAVNVS